VVLKDRSGADRVTVQVNFRSLQEQTPGDAWRQVFDHGWPGWRQWWLSKDGGRGASREQCRMALRRHMPEFARTWEQLVEVVGGGDEVAQFLSFWSPPRYLVHCSQAVLVEDEGPVLIRNYDLDPNLNEGTLYKTCWRDRTVVGMVEGMAGLADGMNDAGLVVSLTFGGRVAYGPGFGIPLVVRYLLESCTDVEDAVETLRRLPCHMSYNLTLMDMKGCWATVLLSPDRPPIVTDQRFATNHQLTVELPRHGRNTKTIERAERLNAVLSASGASPATLEAAFLQPPLFSTAYDKGFGTIYTAVYRPKAGTVSLLWPDGCRFVWGMDAFHDRDFDVVYSPQGSQVTGHGTRGPAGHGIGGQTDHRGRKYN
jgi:predicted choloylglycine hydrolase